MKKLRRTAFQVHNKHNRIGYLVGCLMVGLTVTPKKSVRPVEPPEYMG